jgi:hypothetical protein
MMFDVPRVEFIEVSQGDRNAEGSIDTLCTWGVLYRVCHVSSGGLHPRGLAELLRAGSTGGEAVRASRWLGGPGYSWWESQRWYGLQ